MKVNYPLPAINITGAASRSSNKVNLRDLPLKLLEGIPHVLAFLLEVAITPTHTTAPTTVGVNQVLSKLDFWDGSVNRFTSGAGGLNAVRAWERLSNGRVVFPDADTDTASGTARYFRRLLEMGPANFLGNPDDFAIPTAMLQTGNLAWESGVLTDISADCTAYTATVKVTAILDIKHEINIPPAYVRELHSLNSKQTNIPGNCLIESMALLNSASYDAIAAGDFATFEVSAGGDNFVRSADAETIQSAYVADMRPGEVGSFMGEPEAASDDNHKIVNRGTPTALVGGPNDLQVVFHSGKNAKLSKLPRAESNTRIKWSGSQSSAELLFARVLPQTQSVVTAKAAAILNTLELRQTDMKFKGLIGKQVKTTHHEFFPVVVKV